LTKQVKAEVLIDFNKDGIKDPVDRILIYPLDKGYSCIPWDGKNGLGAKVPFGASFNITTKILTGLTNFPIFDPENNPQGLIVKLVRPQKDPSSGVLSDNLTPDPLKVYWDDTKIPGGSSNLQGCLADGANNCHRWVNNFGNDKTINTWWNVFNEETTTPVTNDPVARVDAGLPQKICYNGIGMSEGVTIGTPADPLVNGTYKWRATKGAPNGFVGDPTAAQPSIKLDNTTDDKVYFEVTLTVNGCTAKDSTYIEKRLNKGPIIVGFPSVCQGSQALTYKALDPLAKNHVWAITGGVITSPQGRDSIVVNWLTPGAGNIRVSTTYADCPPMSTDFAVDIKSNNLISPIPIGEIVVCQSATDVYVYEAPYSPNYKYFWNIVSADFVGDALDYIGNGVNKLKVYFNQDPSPNPSAVIKLRITNTDNGCFDATETLLNVKVNPRPNIVENTFQICSDDTTRIINPIGGRPEWRYQWAPTYGLNDYKVERPRFKFSTTYGDTIKYQVTATNQFNCSYTDTVQVNVYPRPTKIELTGRNFICKETETVYNNPPKEITYTLKTKYSGEPVWRILDKSADRPGINTNIDPNTNSVTVKWDTVRASNLLSYVLKSDKFPNNNQCVTRGNIEITYKKLIVFKPYGDTVVCINPGIGHYNAYSNGGSVYTWEALNGTVTNTSKPDSVDVQWDVTKFTNNPQGPYKLWVFQTNAEDDECKVEKEEYKLKVQLVDQTIITASADTSICIGSPLTVRAFPAEMGRYMTWTPKNAPGAPLIKDTSVYRYTPTQTTVPGTPADFEVTFDNGCKATENVLVNINPNPGNPILAKLITFCSDNQESDTIVTKPDLPSQGPYDYKWEPLGDFESITPSDSSSIIVNKEQPYTLTIYNTFGCFTFDTVVVNDVCPPRIFVPKAITPDVAKDPDKNDVLKIFGANFINFKMRIFNRWGEVIYETTDKNQSWDGTYNGEPVPFGVYPYVITYDSEYEKDNENPRMLNGSVTVIR
jgi:gliding motility-associated-like protein